MLQASGMTTLGALPAFLLSSQAVLIRDELDFDEAALGMVVGTFFGAAAVTAALSAGFVDVIGRRRSTVLAGAAAGAGGLYLAISAGSYRELLAAMVGLGVANALLQLTANLILARGTPHGRQGLAFGIKQSAVPLAFALGGLAVPTVGALLGWRWTFAIAGVTGLVLAGSSLRFADQPATREQPTAGVQRPPASAVGLTALAMAAASATVNALGAFLPSWAHVVGLTPSQAGVLVAVGAGTTVAMRVRSGYSADRRNGRNFPVVAWQLLAGAAGLALMSLGQPAALVAGALVALGIGWAWPGLLLFAVVRIGRDTPAAAAGWLQAGAFAGGATGPVLFGGAVAVYGYRLSWLGAALMLVVAATLLVLARGMFRRDLRTRPLEAA
jgi:predicted MFS family arabinose efflux permease